MNTEQLNEMYKNLSLIINYLNKPTFPNLSTIITKEIEKASEQSLNNWINSIPQEFLKVYFDYDVTTDNEWLKTSLRDWYSIPFLHLCNNTWAQAVVSEQLALKEIADIKKKVKEPLEMLSKSVITMLKYSDISELNTDEEQIIYQAQKQIYENLNIYNYLLKKITQWDLLRSNITFSFEDLFSNYTYYEKYFYTYNKDNHFINEIVNNIQSTYAKISMESIIDYNKAIKSLWKQLEHKSVQKELNKMSLSSIQDIVNTINPDFQLKDYFSNVADFLQVKSDTLNKMYGFSKDEILQIKNAVKSIKESVEQKAYPKFDPDNLSDDEYKILELIHEYQEHPEIRNAQINILKDELKQLSAKINEFKDIAINRYNANLLSDDKYDIWINKEIEIYQNYISVKKLEDKLLSNNEKGKNKTSKQLMLKKEYKQNAADFNSILDNIVNDKTDFSNLNNLPNFVVNDVLKQSLNVEGLKNIRLRSYQKFGAKYILHYKKVLLGDEMGLGKTLESLSVMNHLHNEGKRYFVVVAPLSILSNWKREIISKTNLSPYIFHGNTRYEAFNIWKKNGGIIIANYEQCGILKELINGMKLDMIVVDEAHAIKNEFALRTQNIKQLILLSEYVLLMSGTPLENKVREMNSLIRILDSKIAQKISVLSELNSDIYKKNIATVYLRRRRIDVLKDLPKIISIREYSHFTSEQQKEYYDAVMQDQFMLMRRVAFHGLESEKIEKIKKICDDARDNGEKTIIFSYFKEDVIFKLQKLLNNVASDAITGDISAKRRQEIIDEFSKSNDQSVLLCQINAAGYGLNIQAASRVIICEPQLKPSTEQQAISRAYRMGQTHTVTVYHLITEDSIDETMINKLNYKQKIFDKFADKSLVSNILQKMGKEETTTDKNKKIDAHIKSEIMKEEKKRIMYAK